MPSDGPRAAREAGWSRGRNRRRSRSSGIISPAGFEHVFRGVADLAAAGTTEIDEFVTVADAYGLQFAEPERQADVVERYGLTPPSR